MAIYISIFGIIICIIFIFFLLLKYKEYQVNKLEEEVKKLFLERTSLVPSIFEVSKFYVNKHSDIFNELLKLRKKEFIESQMNIKFYKIISTKKLIHHEINFIFRICNKHPQLIKEGRFIYLRNLLIQRSNTIGISIDKYKESVIQFNKLVRIKNFTIIGYLFPLAKKIEL